MCLGHLTSSSCLTGNFTIPIIGWQDSIRTKISPDWHKHTPGYSITIVTISVPKEWTCDYFRAWPTTGVSHADQCYHSVWASLHPVLSLQTNSESWRWLHGQPSILLKRSKPMCERGMVWGCTSQKVLSLKMQGWCESWSIWAVWVFRRLSPSRCCKLAILRGEIHSMQPCWKFSTVLAWRTSMQKTATESLLLISGQIPNIDPGSYCVAIFWIIPLPLNYMISCSNWTYTSTILCHPTDYRAVADVNVIANTTVIHNIHTTTSMCCSIVHKMDICKMKSGSLVPHWRGSQHINHIDMGHQ